MKEREGGWRAIANPVGERGRMPRSTLSIGVGVSSSVSSGRWLLSPFLHLLLLLSLSPSTAEGIHFSPCSPPASSVPSIYLARSYILSSRPPTGGNRCWSGPELVQNRWTRAGSASRGVSPPIHPAGLPLP